MTGWWVLVLAYVLVVAGAFTVFRGEMRRAAIGLSLVAVGLVVALVWFLVVMIP